MARPQSIIWFERLYLLAAALGIVAAIVGWQDLVDQTNAASGPEMTEEFGRNMLLGTLVFSFAVSLLLWYFVARRASNVAKWITTVLVAIGVPSIALSLMGDTTAFSKIASVVQVVLNVAAVVMLFRPDAKAWFDKRPDVSDVFN